MPDLDFITLFNVVQIGFIAYYVIRSVCILRSEKIRKLICKKCESKIYGKRNK